MVTPLPKTETTENLLVQVASVASPLTAATNAGYTSNFTTNERCRDVMKPPMPAPQLEALFKEVDFTGRLGKLLEVSALPDGGYYHWDELRHRSPPEDLTHMEWWAGVKLARNHLLKPISLWDKNGDPFFYGLPDPVLRLIHEIDREAAGGIQMSEEVTNPASRDRYVINSLIEESITSSQLEGAATTKEVAKDMIRSGRKPVDRGEQMILNNFRAMRFIQEHRDDPLTPTLIFQLHRIVTDETLEDPTKAGQFRDSHDNIIIEDGLGNVLHVPPPAEELAQRLDAMCAFANEQPSDEAFIPPVVRAVILHFWIGYDHPFVDGNGRTARALFYWSMLAQGYWLAEYISISQILKKAVGQYSRSFCYTETDNNDITYFLLYHLRVIQRAIRSLQQYLSRKMEEIRRVEGLLRQSADLNYRQLALLSHALKHPGMRYTIESHRKSHDVAYQTARTDLLDLADRKLLIQRRAGRAFVFRAPSNLGDRLATVDNTP